MSFSDWLLVDIAQTEQKRTPTPGLRIFTAVTRTHLKTELILTAYRTAVLPTRDLGTFSYVDHHISKSMPNEYRLVIERLTTQTLVPLWIIQNGTPNNGK
ncbi:hypothetical protein SprV_0401652200 [Sparganum proliferum]